MVDCSVIIVSYNVADLLSACLHSIFAQPAAFTSATFGLPLVEVLVVDSASSDNTVSRVQRQFPQVRLIACQYNIGYTRGNNLALRQARGRHLLLLNPDTVLHGTALTDLIRFMDLYPDVGIVGPHTFNADGTTQATRRRFPTRRIAFFESTWLQPYAPKEWLRHYYAQDIADDATADVDWVQGSALMARREVYEQVGGLDEQYVMFSEELDWCRRARQRGWRVVYKGDTSITHYGGASTEQVGALKHIYFQQSKLRYFRLYHGRAFAAALRVFLLASYAWQLVLEALKGLLGSQRSLRMARIRTYWRVLRSGLVPS